MHVKKWPQNQTEMYNLNALRVGIGLYFQNYILHDFYKTTVTASLLRMECLEKVKNRQADFLAADPEDMYVAFNLKNEDFSIFSELRTVS